ncbi:MAG: hypothetical protein ACLRV9_07890 [Clostridium sp.]
MKATTVPTDWKGIAIDLSASFPAAGREGSFRRETLLPRHMEINTAAHRREFIRKISQTLNETELSEWDRYHHEKSPCNRVLPDCRGFFIMLWKKFLACRVFGFQK